VTTPLRCIPSTPTDALEGLAEVVNGFTACALWLTTDDDDNYDTYDSDDLSPEAVARIREHCADFVRNWRNVWKRAGMSDDDAGHNLYLTQNGHGTGFWDRGLGELGEQLTRACKPYGTFDLYAGDDGKLYAC
jgi:hypothetical protein